MVTVDDLGSDHVLAHRMFPVAAGRTIVERDWPFGPGVVAAGTPCPGRSSSSAGPTRGLRRW